LDSILYYLHKT